VSQTFHIVVRNEEARRKLKPAFVDKAIPAYLLELLPKLRRVQVACEGVTEVLWEYAAGDELCRYFGSLSREELVIVRSLRLLMP
jgi:hypothetical protein